MSASKTGFDFAFEWRITLFTVLMVPLMISLGFWQLQRAAEKAHLVTVFEERQRQDPAPLPALWDKPAESLAYVPVRVSGRFLSEQYFLLDNQVQDGRVGYQVLGILQLADAAGSVLVNRGWIAGDPGRRVLPEVPAVTGAVNITGHVYVAPGAPYLLAEQQLDEGWPKQIQAVQMDKLVPAVEGLLGGRVFPYPVRMDAGQWGALSVDWQIVNMSAQRHQGYAVQWFTMAAILLVFYLLRSSNLWQLITGAGRTGK